jgi:hypothetical protein
MAHTGSRHAAEPDPEGTRFSHVMIRVVAVLGVFALLVAGAVAVLSSLGSASDTPGPTARPTCAAHTLRVTVDPAIEDAVLAATADLSEFAADQGCLAVEVDVRPSAVVAAELSGDVAARCLAARLVGLARRCSAYGGGSGSADPDGAVGRQQPAGARC